MHNKCSIIANISYICVTPESKLCLDITSCVRVHELEIIIIAYGYGMYSTCILVCTVSVSDKCVLVGEGVGDCGSPPCA